MSAPETIRHIAKAIESLNMAYETASDAAMCHSIQQAEIACYHAIRHIVDGQINTSEPCEEAVEPLPQDATPHKDMGRRKEVIETYLGLGEHD